MLWLSRAAAAGVAKAQNYYGRMLQEGRGVAADPRLAAEFFEKAATQGDTDGMVNLGAACLVGRGVPQDEARARELVSRAADAGDDDARRLLNAMDGRCRSDDDPKAMAEPAPTPKLTAAAKRRRARKAARDRRGGASVEQSTVEEPVVEEAAAPVVEEAVVEEAAAPVVEEAVVEEAAAPVVEEPAVDVPTAPSRDVDGPAVDGAAARDRESDAEAVAAPAPAVDEPAWRRRWGAGLKAGDGVDARDSEGRWFDSVVVDVDGSRVKVHFRGWSTRWDSWFDRDDEGFWANVEPRFALTEDWRRQLRVGDGVETRSEDKPLWYAARVVETSGTSWVAVKTESPGSPSWIETSSERLCQPGTHIKRHRKASSLATKISALKADAVNGDTTAMMKLGRMFLSGDDVPEDPSSAVKLFEDAAARGSVHAMLYLGAAHLVGRGVSCGVDVDRAREFVRRVAAANGGDVRGARRLVALRAIEVDRSQRELIRRTAPADATGDARRALAAPWLASYLARLEDEDEDAPPEAPRAPPPASKPSAAARAPPPETARSLELDAEATKALAQLPERKAAEVLRELARKGEDVRNPSAWVTRTCRRVAREPARPAALPRAPASAPVEPARARDLDAAALAALRRLPGDEAAGILRELATMGDRVRNRSAYVSCLAKRAAAKGASHRAVSPALPDAADSAPRAADAGAPAARGERAEARHPTPAAPPPAASELDARAVRATEDGGPREAEAEAPRDDGFGDATVAEILERLDLRRLLPLFRSHEIDDDSLFHLERADFAEIGVPAPDVPRICAAVAARRKAKTVSVQGEIDGAARHQAQLEAALADHRAEVARLRVGRRAVPEELCCPVTCELMKDPVMADDGHTYERVAIEQWFATGKRTSPKTNESLPSTVVRPNHAVKSMIAGFLDACRRSGVAPDD